MQIALKICIALLPIGIFFYLYFHKFVFDRALILLHSKDLFVGLFISAASLLLQRTFPETDSNIVKAFVLSAPSEELLRYVAMFILIKKFARDFSVTEGIFTGIMIGLGFSFAENIVFSLRYSEYIIFMRCMSSVPIHVFCGAMIGFHIAYAHLCTIKKRRYTLTALGFILPLAYHGIFNFAMFEANSWLYIVPGLIILGYLYVELLIERGRLVFGKDVLEATGTGADSMEVLIRQKEYERWMFDRQLRTSAPVHLFRNHWVPAKTALGLLMIAFAVLIVYSARLDSQYVDDFIKKNQAIKALIVGLPLTLGLLSLLADKINFLFLRETFFRTPKGTLITLMTAEEQHDSLIFEVFPYAIFITGIFEVKLGETVRLRLFHNERSFEIKVLAKWINNDKSNMPIGILLAINRLSPRFAIYRWSYAWQKMIRGFKLSYNNFKDPEVR